MMEIFFITASMRSPEDDDNNCVGCIFISISSPPRSHNILNILGAGTLIVKIWKDQAIHYFINSLLLCPIILSFNYFSFFGITNVMNTFHVLISQNFGVACSKLLAVGRGRG